MFRRLGIACLLVAVGVSGSVARGAGDYAVSRGDLDAIVAPDGDAPRLLDDSVRAARPSTTVSPPTTTPPSVTVPATGPADPPPPDGAPPLGLRPERSDQDFPDPAVVWGGDGWYAFSTSSGGRNLQVSSSPDLTTWTPPADAVPVLPGWAGSDTTWAPSVAPIGFRWVLYVSMAGYGGQCIDRLVSTTPGGPYTAVNAPPLVCKETGGTGAIDPSVSIVDGAPYLYWKAAGATSQQLFGAPLTPDGMGFAGFPRPVLTATARWQSGGIENPSLFAGAGTYWLVYSGAYWATSHYAMGYAQCDSPMGPCHERTGGAPWISTAGDAVGPGGGAVFTGPDGVLRVAFHAWKGGPGYPSGGRRTLHIETLDVGVDGPVVVDAAPQGGIAPLVIAPDGVHLTGLAADPDTPAPVAVAVYLDGRQIAGLAGPGFTVDAAPGDGAHRLCAVAFDDLGQSRPTLGCADFTITSAPFGAVDQPDGAVVTGWAIAPSSIAPIAVGVYVDGAFVGNATADLARDDVAAAWPAYGGAHGFSVAVPTTGPGSHTACVYALVDDGRPAPELGCVTVNSRQ